MLDRDGDCLYDAMVTVIEQLKTLSRSEALDAMEALWGQLRESGIEPPSPQWHKDELDYRDRLIESGEASFSSWEGAKQRIRKRLGK